MNKAAVRKRDAEVENAMMLAAAAIIRTRLVIVESSAAAKLYMESSSKAGFKCRVAYADFTQHASLVAKGAYSKVLCTQPSAIFQKELADKVVALPMTPIIGSVLTRAGGVSLDAFHEKVSQSYGRPRSMFVPVSMPPSFLKHIKSASRRALGPHVDSLERSGIEFQMRMIGAKTDSAASSQADGLVVEEDNEDNEDEVDEVLEDTTGVDDAAPLDTMTKEGLKKAFGREALFMLGAMFQHSSKICEEGQFLDPKHLIQLVKDNGRKTTFRKGQVHASTVYSSLKSVLSTTSAAISPTDCFVQLCGGTPEGVVGAIMMGFNRIIYVGNEKEMMWMQLPTEEEETINKVDYTNYVSPSIDAPDQGFLAAEAVKMLAPYIRNHVFNTADSIKVAAPYEIAVPPLKTYVYIPVTGRVLLRTIMPGTEEATTAQKQEGAKSSAASSSGQGKKDAAGPGSAKGEVPPVTPKVKGKKISADEDMEQDPEEDHEDEEGDLDNDLDELEALEMELGTGAPVPSSGKKRGRPSGKATPGSGKKPKAKAKAAAASAGKQPPAAAAAASA